MPSRIPTRVGQRLLVASKQVEAELGARLPKHLPTSPSAVSPTTAIIDLEITVAHSPADREDAACIRDLPEWILTSHPMSRAHVHLISCLALPIKQVLCPTTGAASDGLFTNPWQSPKAQRVTSAESHQQSQHYTRDESLSYVEQLRRWHMITTNRKLLRRLHEHILEPGPTMIKSVYVRILLQMTLDAMGSYYVEHDLTMLNLDVRPRQRSEGRGAAGSGEIELTKVGSMDSILSEAETQGAGNASPHSRVEYVSNSRGFLGLMRRHTAG